MKKTESALIDARWHPYEYRNYTLYASNVLSFSRKSYFNNNAAVIVRCRFLNSFDISWSDADGQNKTW